MNIHGAAKRKERKAKGNHKNNSKQWTARKTLTSFAHGGGVGYGGCLADGICKGERRGSMREQEEVRSMACAHGGRAERVAEGISGMGKEWPQPGEGEDTEGLEGDL